MSLSPPIRRLSVSNAKHEEDLINAYEAEEERLINLLSRKLEKLREEKVALENIREVESESQVNRLSRELSALRLAQQQALQAGPSQENGATSSGEASENRPGMQAFLSAFDPLSPSTEVIMDALRKENEQLRNRLGQTEREFIRVSRLNEIYREELIDHRRRLGLPVDNLIGLSTSDPYSQPIHLRSYSQSSSPSTSLMPLPPAPPVRSLPGGVPIPRPPSQIRRPVNNISEITTPLSRSPSSSDSPFPLSPVTSTNPASFLTNDTSITTPPSSASLLSNPPAPYPAANHTLSYPSVPPPSLSSSYGSPIISYHRPPRDPSLSPIEARSRRDSYQRRGSFERRPGHAAGDSSGSLRSISRSQSRRESVERGVRVAETGILVPRSRTSSVASPMQQPINGEEISRQETIPELSPNL
ncbi:hypothetical protein NEOLEDRAFT_1067957 [Neolentinus lepideus HHB14362 ss-1]|uniref:Uncharacterized protein n=1 Tax=Neolentinus lepideus HHB14362 ss-1 TaxID=1314782 RepID=A0A165RR51_9AGAM|nr:hypothetical protein NEOLEDRAFT_1067957 [Neolentinus lepideus HHB14362 ss-1]